MKVSNEELYQKMNESVYGDGHNGGLTLYAHFLSSAISALLSNSDITKRMSKGSIDIVSTARSVAIDALREMVDIHKRKELQDNLNSLRNEH